MNFAGDDGHRATDRAWAPEVLERLRRVKATVDPTDLFGGALTPATAPAGVR